MIDVLKYDKLIKNIAKKYCYNPNDYEDYVQEGYLVALKLLNKIKDEHLPENVIKAKLIIWVRNRLIDMSGKFVPIPDSDSIVEDLAAVEDMDIAIVEISASLPERARKIFDYQLEGIDKKDIIKALDISERTYYRDCELIKKELKDAITQ